MFRNVCHRAFRGSRGAKGPRKKNVRWSRLHGRGGARRFYTAAKCMRIIDSDAIAIHHGCNLITTRYAPPVHGIILQYTCIVRRYTAGDSSTAVAPVLCVDCVRLLQFGFLKMFITQYSKMQVIYIFRIHKLFCHFKRVAALQS